MLSKKKHIRRVETTASTLHVVLDDDDDQPLQVDSNVMMTKKLTLLSTCTELHKIFIYFNLKSESKTICHECAIICSLGYLFKPS